jgi:cyanophycinase
LFSQNAWTVVRAAAGPDDPAGRAALGHLCWRYRKPVGNCIRKFISRRGDDSEKSEDLTRAFFAHVLQIKLVETADPDRGSFRRFLCTVCRNFVIEEWKKRQLDARNGPVVSPDAPRCAEGRYSSEPASPGASPEEWIEFEYACGVLETALEVVRSRYAAEVPLFDQLRPDLPLHNGDLPDRQDEAAARLSVTAGNFVKQLLEWRDEFALQVRCEIARTLHDPSAQDVEEELRQLLAIVCRLSHPFLLVAEYSAVSFDPTRPVSSFRGLSDLLERAPHRVLVLAGLLAALAVGSGFAPGDRKQQPVQAEESTGALVIQGGGATPDAVRDRFLELAGGQQARLVVIPTASADAHRTDQSSRFEFWQKTPAATVVHLHTLDRDQANDAAFVKPLTEATGVWLGGGDQARLIAAYRGTAVERELHKLLARGGVIGGTSAGASAMSALMIVGGDQVAQVGPGFGFALVEDVVIDQHFTNRDRLPRLQGILTRHPNYLGLGIDAETAVVIQGCTATVIGEANVRLCLSATVREMEPVQVYKDGDRIDLGPLRQAVQVATK